MRSACCFVRFGGCGAGRFVSGKRGFVVGSAALVDVADEPV